MEESKRPCYRIHQTKAPFSPELREFIADSRKSQTLYYNCEGAYIRRVLKTGGEVCLADFIYNTLYHEDLKRGLNRLTETNVDKIKLVDSIQKLMFRISKRYHSDGEVHFTVVWVYYFHYSLKKKMALPLFKIYKHKQNKDKNDAIFVDVDLRSYDGWDFYLETAQFPESFLCVPRHGEYRIDTTENKMDLEFMNSIPDNLAVDRRNQKFFTPFSEGVVYPLITRITEFRDSVKEKIEALIAALQNFWRENKSIIIPVVTFVAIVAAEVFAPPILPSTIQGLALMLLDCHKKPDELMMERKLCLSELGSHVPRSVPEEHQSKIAEFLELVQQKEKNWKRIFRLLCSFLMKGRQILYLFQFLPAGVLKFVSGIFMAAELFYNSKYLNPDENGKTIIDCNTIIDSLAKSEKNNVVFSEDKKPGSDGDAGVDEGMRQPAVECIRDSVSFQKEAAVECKGDSVSFQKEPAVECKGDSVSFQVEPAVECKGDSVSFQIESTSECLAEKDNLVSRDQVVEGKSEKFFPFLDTLKTLSSSEIQSKALEYYHGTSPTQVNRILDEYRISDQELCCIFMSQVSLPRWTKICQEFFSRKFSLKYRRYYEIMYYEIVDPSGNIRGIVLFPSKFSAICVFLREVIESSQ